jgi:hypothetical protein
MESPFQGTRQEGWGQEKKRTEMKVRSKGRLIIKTHFLLFFQGINKGPPLPDLGELILFSDVRMELSF